jgi:hypothetical protein
MTADTAEASLALVVLVNFVDECADAMTRKSNKTTGKSGTWVIDNHLVCGANASLAVGFATRNRQAMS